MKRLLPVFCVLFLVWPYTAFPQEYQDVTPGRPLKFPDAFHFQRDYRVQWWYVTGHLFEGKGREFGFELTFFVVGVQKRDYRSEFGTNAIYISHFAVTDAAGKKFYYTDNADAGAFDVSGASDTALRVWVGDALLKGTMEEMHIKASDRDKSLELTLVPTKPVVLHGKGGFSRKSEESPLIASYYFSYTSMETKGVLRIGSTTFRVTGKSWFDRELSSRGLGKSQTGWDWFALQLDDGREIMLYLIRNKDGSIDRYSSGTVVYKSGSYRHLPVDDFSITVLDRYTSKKTGARYPSQWEIKIPSEELTLKITPLLQDQEILATATTRNYYWEGACAVEGNVRGRAYVELVGY
ncbi:MAG: lipocalin-like domain-containing protein [Nitrospirota bacterium]